MADVHSPLDQLADISEPAWHNGFELPPIAWIALLILLWAFAYAVLRWYRRWRYLAAKREAIDLLSQLADKPDCATQANQLIKRVLQHYQAAHPALSLPVAQWQQWLSAGTTLTLPNLTELLYSAVPDQQASQQFYLFAQHWLQQYDGKAPMPGTGGQHA